MKYSASKAVGNFQDQLNDQVNRQTMGSAFKGLGNTINQVARTRVARDQTNRLQSALQMQVSDLAMSKQDITDPLQRAAIDEKINQLTLLGAGTNLTNVGDFFKNYQGMFDKSSSLLDLANDLRKTEIMAKSRVDAANAYGKAKRTDREIIEDVYKTGGGAITGTDGGLSNALQTVSGGLFDDSGIDIDSIVGAFGGQ